MLLIFIKSIRYKLGKWLGIHKKKLEKMAIGIWAKTERVVRKCIEKDEKKKKKDNSVKR